MTKTNMTADEVFQSLTGHEEMWVADQFGKPIGSMLEGAALRSDSGPYCRALIFILKRRAGENEDDARNAVMDMPMKDVLDYFPNEKSEDPADQAAVAESGKGEPEPEHSPTPSLSSVS